jgi:hypothetical protein
MTTACIACTGRETTETPSSIAPFVVHRAGLDSDATMTVHCTECGCRFSSVRLDDKQNERLYEGYRGQDYTEQRETFEPGYAIRNDMLTIRRPYIPQVEDLIAGVVGEPATVLDYGSDSTLNTPFADRAVTYDIGDEPPTGTYDLIVLAHVLEHVPYPLDVVRQARSLLTPRGYIYAEVPDETPRKVWHEHMTQFSGVSLLYLFDGQLPMYRSYVTPLGAVHAVVAS